MSVGGSPPPPPPVTPLISGGRSWWQSWWVVTLVAVGAVVAIAAAIGLATGGSDDTTTTAQPTTAQPPTTEPSTTEPATTEPSATEPGATDQPATDPSDTGSPGTEPPETDPDGTDPGPPPVGEIAGAPNGERGDRTAPVPAGRIADIGDGWRLQILGVIDDGTELVFAENSFNDPPPDGSRYTLVDIALGYYGSADPASAFEPNFEGRGLGGVALDDRCGVIPNDFRSFIDLFAGGVTRGTICFVTTPSDTDVLQIAASVGFDGAEVVLDASSSPSEPPALPTLRGPQPGALATEARTGPVPLGNPVDLGAGWILTVTSPAADITDAVLAENQFNDPPPEGSRFVGVGVELTYEGDGTGSGFDVTVNAVSDSNVELDEGCGVVPTPADLFADVPSGTSVTGTFCVVAPAEDVATVAVYGTTEFGAVPTFLAAG